METVELTLRPSKRIVELAHRLAEEENTSITQMFSEFILARHNKKIQDKIPIGPLTRSVTGIMKVPNDWDYKKEMEDILEEKYGLNHK